MADLCPYAAAKGRTPETLRASADAADALTPATRLALVILADKAPDQSPLAWPSQPTLARLIGIGPTYVGRAIQPLASAGLLSVWDRTVKGEGKARGCVYLVHPHGTAGLALDRAEVARHLEKWRAGDAAAVAAVMAWLASKGVLPAETIALSARVKERSPHSVQGNSFTQCRQTTALSATEPKEPERNPAAPRPRRPPGPGGAAAVSAWATPAELAAIKAEAARLAQGSGAAGDRAA